MRGRGHLRALASGLRGPRAGAPPEPPFDSWLDTLHGATLAEIDERCADGAREHYARFRELPVDTWTVLLGHEYEAYPHIRALLPDLPPPDLQELWNGASGRRLGLQSQGFYRRVRERWAAHGAGPMSEAKILDFGCGWGRLTRFFARDVQPGALFGCDPVERILEECRAARVPATLGRSEFVPESLPFDETFDLAYSFSVFTHISERAADACVRALHGALAPGGLLVVTVRPPEYLNLSERMHHLRDGLGAGWQRRLATEPHYLFAPHEAEPSHLQYDGGEMTYGETLITPAYLRERWGYRFEVLGFDPALEDPYQVMVTLRRR